jgi:hypothetical protein
MKAIFAALSSVGLLIYPTAQNGVTEVVRAVSGTETIAPMALNSYSRFPRNIGSAPVYDLNGHRVGQIQKLDTDPTGKPAGLEIWLPSGRTVTVVASNISYDEQQNIITAGLTDVELGLPPAPSPTTEQKR